MAESDSMVAGLDLPPFSTKAAEGAFINGRVALNLAEQVVAVAMGCKVVADVVRANQLAGELRDPGDPRPALSSYEEDALVGLLSQCMQHLIREADSTRKHIEVWHTKEGALASLEEAQSRVAMMERNPVQEVRRG